MPEKPKRKLDYLGLWHCEEYYVEHDLTPRMKRRRTVALEVIALDELAERYLVKFLKKRKELVKKMRNMI